MDPMTQSAQISSSQGLGDGQNSASKESKPTDSFLTSSPVSLIQSSQDKKLVLGPDKPCEGTVTSLRFSSQPGSFSPYNYGSDVQPESPIKTSPVSERIKALEALAAKKETDFRNNDSLHLKDRHHDKSPSDIAKPPTGFQKLSTEKNVPIVEVKRGSTDYDSPESPFEVLGDLRQVNEFEETEEWMKAHLPPVPDFDAERLVKCTITSELKLKVVSPDAPPSITSVPDTLMDFPSDHNQKGLMDGPQKLASVDDPDFDLNFLPTTDMWVQKDQSGFLDPSGQDTMLPDCPVATLDVMGDKMITWTEDLEPAEAREVDSSEESDETVIEDGFTPVVPPPNSTSSPSDITCPETSGLPEERVMPPARSERKLMQVPTINVIETEEPNCSDDEMEIEFETEHEAYDEVVKQGTTTAEPALEDRNETHNRRPLETEFLEGYSPPSSPIESEDEYSPKQKIVKSPFDIVHEKSAPTFIDSGWDVSYPQPEKCKTTATSSDVKQDVNVPDKDEWSTEFQQNFTKTHQTDFSVRESPNNKAVAGFSKSFMRDDTYDGQSFDYEPLSPFSELEIKPKGLKDHFLSDFSEVVTETQDASHEIKLKSAKERFMSDSSETKTESQDPSQNDNETKSVNHRFSNSPSQITNNSNTGDGAHEKPTKVQQDSKVADSSISEPVDSFVEFMRECLKSSDCDESNDTQDVVYGQQSPPTMVMDIEQEHLTISALKQLGCSQEEEDDTTCILVANSPHIQSNTLCCDSTYSEGVEAIDIWVAEAYHLAEHVLTAILTHVSVKDLIHWRDPKKSGLVFGLSMLLLLSLAAFSVISVASYLLLALLCVTITFRIYKSVIQAVQKSSDGHPFKSLMDKDVRIPPETFRKHVDVSLTYINRALKQMSRLFLVEDLVDSLKLAVVMWLLTYVGAVFNGITILILADILLFAVPPIYEKNKTQIDQYIDLARNQINTTMAKLQEKLPGAVKRSKTE
ncbi:reticulon-3 isoform X1 [Nerophis lumbriciformis]|uniref:reticulon-3 isoform X1 n=1 Tax=Nerophis lumbriciformis TaxID=546530 RepID=UPI002ADFB476|nr:reticulon-3-like isoform X1 [Nerophis lumbriciformis]